MGSGSAHSGTISSCSDVKYRAGVGAEGVGTGVLGGLGHFLPVPPGEQHFLLPNCAAEDQDSCCDCRNLTLPSSPIPSSYPTQARRAPGLSIWKASDRLNDKGVNFLRKQLDPGSDHKEAG